MKKPLSFLLLEDSPLDAEFLLDQLLDGGVDCDYIRVETREEFTEALRNHPFDLILADYSLPAFNGMEALSIAQELRPEIPFIFVSGRLGEELAIESLKMGATDYVVKHRLERLVPAITRALSEAEERSRRQYIERSLAVLSEASIALASSLDYQTTLSSITRFAVPHFADICIVDIITDNGSVNRLNVTHVNPDEKELVSDLMCFAPTPGKHTHPVTQVLETGQAKLLTELSDELIERAFQEKAHREVVRRLHPKSGMIVPLEARGRILGAISFISCRPDRVYSEMDLALAHDLAHRAALSINNAHLHEQTLQAVRLRDEFLATVSHELRTPLSAVLGWVGLLRNGSLQGEDQQRAIETIERNARAQAKLIDDLLDVSRIISGKLTIAYQPVNLHGILEAVRQGLQPTASTKNIDCRLVPLPNAAAPLIVLGDAQRLEQVVWNLLSNAVKFTPPDGQIELEVFEQNDKVVVSVSDSGPGIDAEFLPYVFERFRQADGSSTRRHGGLGLGLAIVRHLTELHGGNARVESPGRLGGATFQIHLPFHPTAEEPQSLSLPTTEVSPHVNVVATSEYSDSSRRYSGVLNGVRVLVVDDDDDGREVITLLLRRSGAEVHAVSSAPAALAAINTYVFDALLSDIGMPDENGYSLMQRVKEWERDTGRRLPGAAVTAYTRERDRYQSLEAGFHAHITKPVEPQILIDTVRALMRATDTTS